MFTVKKFTTGQTILSIKLSDEKSLVWQCTTSTPDFVIMKDDKPYFQTNRLTGKKELEIYGKKSVAKKVADWYNS